MTKITKRIERIALYTELAGVRVKENGDVFVPIDTSVLSCGYRSEMADTSDLFGKIIPVRKKVYEMLLEAQKELREINPNLRLHITYGYRSMKIQTKKFLEILKEKSSVFYSDPVNLYQKVHELIAVPDVAGHPTGGAVDLIIVDKNDDSLDFGSKQYDFSTNDCYVFSRNISEKSKRNRQLLRECMTDVGFAAYDGEWWHFSYGDKEWAFLTGKKYAKYKQISVRKVRDYLNGKI